MDGKIPLHAGHWRRENQLMRWRKREEGWDGNGNEYGRGRGGKGLPRHHDNDSARKTFLGTYRQTPMYLTFITFYTNIITFI